MNKAATMTAEQALELWLKVPRVPISKKERAVLAAAENFVVPFRGQVPPGGDFALPVTAWGAAGDPLVLLVHGWGGHRAQLAAFTKPLVAAGLRAVSFDAPAHGDLPGTHSNGYQLAEAMRAVVGKVGRPRAIIAHSLGTMAVTVALQDWLKVEKLIFFGPMRRLSDTLEPFLKLNDLPAEMAPELKRITEARFDADVWERTALDLALPKFDIPALIFHDREDGTTPYISGVGVARAWRSAKLVTTRGLGHRGALKDPDVIKQVVDFIAT
ncbi:MAG: alpha/beta hydrolase [Anaerolineales bacterium]